MTNVIAVFVYFCDTKFNTKKCNICYLIIKTDKDEIENAIEKSILINFGSKR